jgi:subtilisin family serine protease
MGMGGRNMAKDQAKLSAARSGRAGTKDVATATWVVVETPPGCASGHPVEVDSDPGVGSTNKPFDVAPGQHVFRVVCQDERHWSSTVTCSGGTRAKPQEIDLDPEPAGFGRGVLRSNPLSGDEGPLSDRLATANLVVSSGKRPDAETVVYIHGIGNKPAASVLKCQWDTALFGSDMGDRTRMVYWVDRDRYPRSLEATCGQADQTATDDDEASTATIMGLSGDAAPSSGPAREEVALTREIQAFAPEGARRQKLEAIRDRLVQGADKAIQQSLGATEMAEMAERRRAPGYASTRILPLPEPFRSMMARLLTRIFLRDVNDFLFDTERRRAMTDALWDRLRGGGEPFVIIAHSQGSMVAYDLLRWLKAEECKVPLLVTIGSPLGLQEVKDHFRRQGGGLTTPECVERWINVADRLDPVAVDPSLANEYGKNSGGIGVEDVSGWGLNLDSPRHPHSATGYLHTPAVRDAVREVVGNAFSQFVAGSLVSRDVAADAEDAGTWALHDVLVQLSDLDDRGPPQPIRQVAEQLVEGMRRLAETRPKALPFDEPDVLRRFVQARLTRAEIDGLRTLSTRLKVKQVWANARKHALINESAATVQAPTANIGYKATGRGITWAVVDSGIDWSHPHFAFQDNVKYQWDCMDRAKPRLLDRKKSPNPDENGHGTHVAGIIAGSTTNALVGGQPTIMSGMAPEARIYGFRSLDARGEGSDTSIIKALDLIAEINEASSALVIHGVNVSLGSNFDPKIYGVGHTPLCQELRRLWRQGVLVCIAAGNEGYAQLRGQQGVFGANMDLSIGDPANLEEAIAVGSVHRSRPHTYGISYFSSRGPTADGRRKPDVVAPGEKILSALAGAKGNFHAQGGADVADWYVEMSGTSMACPHVSGILAAFLSVRREFIGEPDRVKQILLDNCTDLGRDPNMQGAGLVNLVKMLVAT